MGDKTNPKRFQKLYVQKQIIIGKIEEDPRITVYAWPDNPVELWVWDLVTGRVGPHPSKIELHGLEHYPSLQQLEPALAMLALWRENFRRKEGTLAGPGLYRDPEIYQLFVQWKESGFGRDTKRQLVKKYGQDHLDDPCAEERLDRQFRRWKNKGDKRD